MIKTFLLLATTAACFAQIAIPEGTKIRLRLDQPISSATAEHGQTIEFSVTQAVQIGDVVVIGEGARATGAVTEVSPKRRMGRAGKLDFSIDRVMTVDGKWLPLRYSLQKNRGQGRGLTTGIVAAGIAVAAPIAAPAALLIKGKDVTVNRGVVFDVFADENQVVAGIAPGATKATARGLYASASAQQGDVHLQNASLGVRPVEPAQSGVPAAQGLSGAPATVTIASAVQGADIEIDGVFVGSTPSTLQIPAGQRRVTVREGTQLWERTVNFLPGATISLNASLPGGRAARASSRP